MSRGPLPEPWSLTREAGLDILLAALPPGTPITVFRYGDVVTARIGGERCSSDFGEGASALDAVLAAWTGPQEATSG